LSDSPSPGFIPAIGQAAIPLSQYNSGPGAAPTTVSIVAAGDIACDPSKNVGQPQDCDQAATADMIGQLHPTAVLTLGDNQYEDNTFASYLAVFDKTWGRYKSIIYPTIGNHEYLTSNAAGYFGYFGFPSYYSFDLGNWHIVSLNSECHFVGGCGPNSPQERWLKEDLSQHPGVCTMLVWHEPRFSSGEHQDATQMSTIWADAVAAHVDVVLTGHNHDYERFVPLDGNGSPDPAGTTEFVVGTGGKNHYGFVEPALPGEVVRNDGSFGLIMLRLGPGSYSWRFYPAPGYSFTDSGTANCH
jgi:acid phosphatase type 7